MLLCRCLWNIQPEMSNAWSELDNLHLWKRENQDQEIKTAKRKYHLKKKKKSKWEYLFVTSLPENNPALKNFYAFVTCGVKYSTSTKELWISHTVDCTDCTTYSTDCTDYYLTHITLPLMLINFYNMSAGRRWTENFGERYRMWKRKTKGKIYFLRRKEILVQEPQLL